ncbi:hypothetical protein TPA0906_11430 [Streptomyces olivaceus]|nr:hypothetical protein TPA0906_11430 [Streptomyces olivaceus]
MPRPAAGPGTGRVTRRPQTWRVTTRGGATGKTRGWFAESQNLSWGARSFPEVDAWLTPTKRLS